MIRRGSALLLLVLIVGCAVRLGGPQPRNYTAVAIRADQTTSMEAIRHAIESAGADLALIAAPADTAWFEAIAERTGHTMSGPGMADGVGLALFAGEAVGDTTVFLRGQGGAGLVLQDALYEVSDGRYLDLILVRVEPDASAVDAADALLDYIATDVMQQSAVVLGIDAGAAAGDPTGARMEALADSLSGMLRPAFMGAAGCEDVGPSPEALDRSGMRFLYGPELRILCEQARLLPDGGSRNDGPGNVRGIIARIVVRR